MTVLLPYHQRMLIRISRPTEYHLALSTPANSRWYPLFRLLSERFRGDKGFSDYEVGALLGLREEYENGLERKG
jgi:hypothetical protein